MLATVALIVAFIASGNLNVLTATAVIPGLLALFFFHEYWHGITGRDLRLGAMVLVSEAVIFLLSYVCPAVLDGLLGQLNSFGFKVEFCIPALFMAYVFTIIATSRLFIRQRTRQL